MSTGLQKIMDTYDRVIEEGHVQDKGQGFRSYAISNLRGGVGKSSIAFNLAYEVSRTNSLLTADVCPQTNFTEMLLGGYKTTANIYDALKPVILGPAFGEEPEDISYRISQHCDPFKGGRAAFAIPGNAELFAFPSTLYAQLDKAWGMNNRTAVAKLLRGLKQILDREAKDKDVRAEKILIDTSPFYAGGTHLAWCAVEALIVPVRVDEHSVESLGLLFKMLSDPERDFLQWNERAGDLPGPKIAAIVMTMVGAKNQRKNTPDRASTMYIERALELAEAHADLFAVDPSDAFVITDDFHSAGRISGAKRKPISMLEVGSFHTVENRRLQVNRSVTRYQKELQYLASVI